MLYGSDFRPAFDAFWDHAKRHYNPIRDGKVTGSVTMYYDPLVPCHHPVGDSYNFQFGTAHGVLPLYPGDARVLYDDAIGRLNWREEASTGPDDATPENTGDPMASFVQLMARFLAREFGDEAVHARLQARSEAHDEPSWGHRDRRIHMAVRARRTAPERSDERHRGSGRGPPRRGAWADLLDRPNLRKFLEPTVHGVDFPKVCLSQATYDVERRLLAVATDAGAPRAAGEPTTFRITNVDPDRCVLVADGAASDDWRAVEGDMEISTTVGEHTFVVRMN